MPENLHWICTVEHSFLALKFNSLAKRSELKASLGKFYPINIASLDKKIVANHFESIDPGIIRESKQHCNLNLASTGCQTSCH